MSLLERRRALLETAKDAKEGGGINDGKYVVVGYSTATKYSPTYVQYSASIDYGKSFNNVNRTVVTGDKSCAECLNSRGEFMYHPYSEQSSNIA